MSFLFRKHNHPANVHPFRTLGEFRQITKDLPDDTEMFLPEYDMPGHRRVHVVTIAKIGYGMAGPYEVSPEDERKYPHLYHDSKRGVFF